MRQTKQRTESGRRMAISGIALAVLAIGGAAVFTSADPANAATTTVVSATKNAQFGTILISGKTVYTLKASSTACTATCLKVWPAVLLPNGVTKAQAGNGVNASKLGTVKRGGALQVTYSGKPLYRFVGDTRAGQVRGNVTDTWGKWSVFVTTKPSPSSSGSDNSSGTGSGGSTAGTGGVSF